VRYLTLAQTRRRQAKDEGTNYKHDAAGCGEATTTTGPGRRRHLEDFTRIRDTAWDLVIGSDLIYNDMGVECLPRVGRGR
jgi:hypothetical protein